MLPRTLLVMPLLAALVVGCGAGETEPAPVTPAPVTPGPSCEAPEIALPDGSCIRPGIAPGDCYEGFVHDGEYGCEPILPAEPCPAGLMAVPGETECRPVMGCGEGTWGELPTDESTEHVDGSYAGGSSDGSAEAPWTTIGKAIAAAAPGALVAVAAGSYVEEVVISGKPVRLWGRCPELVEVVGTGKKVAAVLVPTGANGAEVGGLAIRGDAIGVGLSGSQDVTVDRVWVHDTASRGIDVEDTWGPSSVSVKGSLVERARDFGLFVMGSDALVEGTLVRDTMSVAYNQESGRGINIQLSCTGGVCDPTARANATVRGSLIEGSRDVGLVVAASNALVEGTVVRNTLPQASDLTQGLGIMIQNCGAFNGCDVPVGANATVRGSLVEQSHEFGVFVAGSDAIVEGTIVRDTLPAASDQRSGCGIGIAACVAEYGCEVPVGANATIRNSLIERSHEVGLLVTGSEAVVEGTVVRDTLPRASDQTFGRGVFIEVSCTREGCDPNVRANATVRGLLVERSHEVGLSVMGSDASMEGTVVRDTVPQVASETGGRGLNVQPYCVGSVCYLAMRPSVTIRNSLVERSHEIGLFVGWSDAIVEATVVRDTLPRLSDGFFGDGIDVAACSEAPASVTITGGLVANSARAGLASFGASVSLGSTRIQCAGYELEGEPLEGQDFVFEDLGGNGCGCPTADDVCVVQSAWLEPPEPVGPFE